MDTSPNIEALVSYIERVAVCTAVAVGSAFIYSFAQALPFGPWVPVTVAAILFLAATFLLIHSSVLFTGSLTSRSNSPILAGLIGVVLNLACSYFVLASVMAATQSLHP